MRHCPILFAVAPKFRVPGLFWEWEYLKHTVGWGAGVSKQHLLSFVSYLFSARPRSSARLFQKSCQLGYFIKPKGLFCQAVYLESFFDQDTVSCDVPPDMAQNQGLSCFLKKLCVLT